MQEMQEALVQSLGQEDPLEEGMATPLVFLPEKAHGQGGLGYNPWDCKELNMTETHTLHWEMVAVMQKNFNESLLHPTCFPHGVCFPSLKRTVGCVNSEFNIVFHTWM